MLLRKIELNDWRGLSYCYNFGANVNRIIGKNRSGKSHAYDAFLWTLTGKDSHLRSNYDCFNTTNESREASALIEVDCDGIIHSFKRTIVKEYENEKGNSERYKGAKTSLYINGVLKSAKEYYEFIETNIASIDNILLCCRLWSFQEKTNAEQISLLTSLVDIETIAKEVRKKYTYIMNKSADYAGFGAVELLSEFDINYYKTTLESKQKEIKKMLNYVPCIHCGKHPYNVDDTIISERAQIEDLLTLLKMYHAELYKSVEKEINKYFNGYIHCGLTSTTIEGDTVIDCRLYFGNKNTRFSSNTEALINGFIDLCDTFQYANKIKLPIFVDNAESVNKCYRYCPHGRQMIFLEAVEDVELNVKID